jgi:hypothetical protein
MNKLTTRQWVVYIIIFLFGVGAIISFNLPEEKGADFFMILILVLFVLIPIFIWSAKNNKFTRDTSAYDITYKYLRTDFTPIGSLLLTIVSLIWMLVSKIQDEGPETAIAFFIGFGFLSFFEIMYQWWKVTKYNEFVFSFDAVGILISKDAWSKKLLWSNYNGFGTVYQARLGRWVRYIPLLSMLVHETDRNLINLYRTAEYLNQEVVHDLFTGDSKKISYDRIPTLPKNHEQVIAYIKKYLPEKNSLTIDERL